jgi:hypothetical protein
MFWVKFALVISGISTFVCAPSFASMRFRWLAEQHRLAKLYGREPMPGAEIARLADISYKRWVALAFFTAIIGIVL